MQNPPEINSARLWSRLMEMASFGPGLAGGNNRQALTAADGAARAQLCEWAAEAGLTLRTDRIGNQYFWRPGHDTERPPLALGSHLDTQPTGGRFDGVLGVLAGLEVMQTLADAGVETDTPLMLINWTNEEGARFHPAMMGSAVWSGALSLDRALSTTDADGVDVATALEAIGGGGDLPPGQPEIGAYLELHIEQGPILEAEGVDIGIVTAAQGEYWLEVEVKGRSAHAGSTPMDRRADAGLGMIWMAEAVNRLAVMADGPAVGTVGRMSLEPGAINVVPGLARFTVDFRAPDVGVLDKLRSDFQSEVKRIADALDLAVTVREIDHMAPVNFDDALANHLRDAADAAGLSRRDIVSGAGHDACQMAARVPSAMLFCPCVDGISHNEAEAITESWAANATQVLLATTLAAAGASAHG